MSCLMVQTSIMHALNVISLTAIQQMFMQPLEDREVIAQVDVATAFLQLTPFGPDEEDQGKWSGLGPELTR